MVKYTFQIEDILKIFKTGEIIYIYIYITHDQFTTNHWDTSFMYYIVVLFSLQAPPKETKKNATELDSAEDLPEALRAWKV